MSRDHEQAARILHDAITGTIVRLTSRKGVPFEKLSRHKKGALKVGAKALIERADRCPYPRSKEDHEQWATIIYEVMMVYLSSFTKAEFLSWDRLLKAEQESMKHGVKTLLKHVKKERNTP